MGWSASKPSGHSTIPVTQKRYELHCLGVITNLLLNRYTWLNHWLFVFISSNLLTTWLAPVAVSPHLEVSRDALSHLIDINLGKVGRRLLWILQMNKQNVPVTQAIPRALGTLCHKLENKDQIYLVCVCVCVLVAQFCHTLCNPWTVVCQAPLSMEFSRQEYLSYHTADRHWDCFQIL